MRRRKATDLGASARSVVSLAHVEQRAAGGRRVRVIAFRDGGVLPGVAEGSRGCRFFSKGVGEATDGLVHEVGRGRGVGQAQVRRRRFGRVPRAAGEDDDAFGGCGGRQRDVISAVGQADPQVQAAAWRGRWEKFRQVPTQRGQQRLAPRPQSRA